MGNSTSKLGEVALYAEFGFEGAVVANNTVDGAATGVSITNFNEGGRLAVCQGNLVRKLFTRGDPKIDSEARGVGEARGRLGRHPLHRGRKVQTHFGPDGAHQPLRGGEGHMEVGKVIMNVVDSKCHMTLSVKPFGCMPSAGVSDGVQSLVTARHPDTIFCPIETTGDGQVNVHSRVQMMLFKAHERARNEFDETLTKVGLTAAEARAPLGPGFVGSMNSGTARCDPVRRRSARSA